VTEERTIVLIDPEVDETSSLANRLRMQGYAVSVATDPAEGARMALADPPAAIVADLWMPSISGVQLCRLLKAEPATEHVPVILRGPDGPRNRFWAERAGANSYLVKGRMGDLVRALRDAIVTAPESGAFFTTFAGEDIRDRIAAHLDLALFESVLAAEVRSLSTCAAFDRLFDLLSQFVSRVTTYRWLAVSTNEPRRLGLHANPDLREVAEREARAVLAPGDDALVVAVEDGDASDAPLGPPPIVRSLELGGIRVGQIAISVPEIDGAHDEDLVNIVARELAAPIRMATLVEESQRLASVDGLTGLTNRRAFTAAIEKELARSARYGHPLSVVLFDVDHFKSINDKLGHGTGDMVLSALGANLGKQIRTCDHAARWGGEEFVVALPSTDLDGALCFAERLRASIEALAVTQADGSRVPVTASLGCATYTRSDTLDSLVDRADQAMYAAKMTGRNRVASEPRAEVRASAAGVGVAEA
jgi:two-component system, cell cycle response regulator